MNARQPMTSPSGELAAAAAVMCTFKGLAAAPLAHLLDEYADDWRQCPEDHPGTALDEAALAAARAILGGQTVTSPGEQEAK